MRSLLNGAAAVVAFAIAAIAWPPAPASGRGSLDAPSSLIGVTSACSVFPTAVADADAFVPKRIHSADPHVPGTDPANAPCTDAQRERAIEYVYAICGRRGGDLELWCHASGSITASIKCRRPPDEIISVPPR